MQRGENGDVARSAARAPGEPDQVESAEVEGRPSEEFVAELDGRADHPQRFQARYRQQRFALFTQAREGSDVAQRVRGLEKGEQPGGVGFALGFVLDYV